MDGGLRPWIAVDLDVGLPEIPPGGPVLVEELIESGVARAAANARSVFASPPQSSREAATNLLNV